MGIHFWILKIVQRIPDTIPNDLDPYWTDSETQPNGLLNVFIVEVAIGLTWNVWPDLVEFVQR